MSKHESPRKQRFTPGLAVVFGLLVMSISFLVDVSTDGAQATVEMAEAQPAG